MWKFENTHWEKNTNIGDQISPLCYVVCLKGEDTWPEIVLHSETDICEPSKFFWKRFMWNLSFGRREHGSGLIFHRSEGSQIGKAVKNDILSLWKVSKKSRKKSGVLPNRGWRGGHPEPNSIFEERKKWFFERFFGGFCVWLN